MIRTSVVRHMHTRSVLSDVYGEEWSDGRFSTTSTTEFQNWHAEFFVPPRNASQPTEFDHVYLSLCVRLLFFCTRGFLQNKLSMFLSGCRLIVFLRLFGLPWSDGQFRNSLRNAVCELRYGKWSFLACVCHLPEYFCHFLSPSSWYSLQLNPFMFSKAWEEDETKLLYLLSTQCGACVIISVSMNRPFIRFRCRKVQLYVLLT